MTSHDVAQWPSAPHAVRSFPASIDHASGKPSHQWDQPIGLPVDDEARKMRPEMKQDMRRALQLLMMPAASIVYWRCVVSRAWPPYFGPLDGALVSQTMALEI